MKQKYKERLKNFFAGLSIPVAFVASGWLGNAAGKSVFQKNQEMTNADYSFNPLNGADSYIEEVVKESINLADERRFEETNNAHTDGSLDYQLENVLRSHVSSIKEDVGDRTLIIQKPTDSNDLLLESMLSYSKAKVIDAAKWIYKNLEEIAESAAKTKSGIDYEELYASLERYEGLRTKTYLDTEGIATIGIGFNLTKNGARNRITKMGYDYDKIVKGEQEITKEQARTLMKEDLKIAIKDAKNYMGNGWERLDPRAQAILIDMGYNMGGSFGGIKSLKALLNQVTPDYSGAARRMKTYAWYEQTGNRAKELTEKMEEIGKEYNSKN